MKYRSIYFTLLAIVLGLTIEACARDELSKAKVMDLLVEHEAEIPVQDWVTFYIGNRVRLTNERIPAYEEIRDKGAITISPVDNNFFNIQLTELGKTFLVDPTKYALSGLETLFGSKRRRAVYVHTFRYAPHKVEEIHVTPQFNEASANVSYSLIEKTPFALLASERKEFSLKQPFIKTTDGWKYQR